MGLRWGGAGAAAATDEVERRELEEEVWGDNMGALVRA